MNSNKRPHSVTILACVYLAVGTIGFAYHFRELLVLQDEGIWVELSEFLAIVSGAFMLRGHNWARWLALAWIACHVILSAFDAFHALAIHSLFCAVIACLVSFSSQRCAVFSWCANRIKLNGKFAARPR